MPDILTISLPGLEESVQETIQATHYAKVLSSTMFVTAIVERITRSERTALDVLLAYIHSLTPEWRNWAYDAEDDWLLLDQMTAWAARIRPIIKPFMPPGGIPRYHSHTDDSLSMVVYAPTNWNPAF